MRIIVAALAGLMLTGAAQSSSLLDERDALVEQSLTRIVNSTESMSFNIGRCSHIYPGVESNPYVMRARQALAEIEAENFRMLVDRTQSVAYVEGLQKAGETEATVRDCALVVEDNARDVETHIAGFMDLLRRLSEAANSR